MINENMKTIDIGKINIQTAILIGAVIVGGFYFATQISKQNAIERRQASEQAVEDARASKDKFEKTFCAMEADSLASEQYKETCTYDCREGYYYIAQYKNYLDSCFVRKGIK